MAKALFTKNGSIVFTQNYEAGWFHGSDTVKSGTRATITRVHQGLLDVTHVDVRLPDGRILREVSVDYFAV